MENYKVCKDCGLSKTDDLFVKADGKNRKTRNRCKDCAKKNNKICKDLRLKNRPPSSGFCSLCKNYTEKFVLDHCHKTESFRGFLCKDCNAGIGLLRDNPWILLRSFFYLIFHKIKIARK